ncbi:bifunctional WD40 repeat/WD40-YVTN repeat-like-containing domain superfamily/Periodic tryptophan protein 1/WD40-repeat-containing domain superfamily/WD40 repeat [Babesia duncani]|uniref:Bifunctional WD40 repeat/WD40-YVTN repeat-like-containing domain superfamily/Periodic tryptophan protein 1/WD40-repeat-containing domain superfamily/WD40 repeat n=1 Tax=Babesia duncani TaxID=323732 RepID=A0AAD9PKJ2_9APIC|nr:bifunctional WD40 repeat/WD40-YVTN repeat-like-containing domain superfamily/Periodic tryptophan protein 1/WD40-repeat-containing domain superfamily/WD40 repeat [Babesia duncani]
MNVISCVQWLQRSCCDANFFRSYIHNDAEDDEGVERIETNNSPLLDEISKEFDLENYDNDDLVPSEQFFTISNGDVDGIQQEQEDIEVRILDNADRVLIAGCSSDDSASLDIYLYNVDYCGLEAIHSILLPSFPLSCQVIPHADPLVAVGTFEPHIEIWRVGEVDNLVPCMTLSHKSKHQNGHKDAVTSLSISSHVTQLLASGSADTTIKIWDLNEQAPLNTLQQREKVQVVSFNPSDPCTLISGLEKGTMNLVDIRSNKIESTMQLGSDTECCQWYKGDTLIAHKKACTSLQITNDILVTCGLGAKTNVYKLDPNPIKIAGKNLQGGPIFSVCNSPDDPLIMAFGAESLVIWDLELIPDIKV